MSLTSGLRSLVKRVTPDQVLRLHRAYSSARVRRHARRALARSFAYDQARFEAHSAAVRSEWSRENLAAALTMDYHRLEKGMTLKEPRPGYASAWVSSRFIRNLYKYVELCGQPDDLVFVSLNVLNAYRAFHLRHNHSMPELFAEISRLEAHIHSSPAVGGGVVTITRDEVFRDIASGFETMVRARHSVRNFEATPVEGDLIRNAVDLALRAPSVCNRQAWRVYALTSSDAIARALTAQNGNSGFGHQLQMLLVVACDLTRFLTIGERNQGWIDGGMFSMMLVLALHSHGLGTCCLNLSLDCQQDMRLREVVPIADHESPVMMIAVGHMPESLSVAQSRRRPVADVLTWVGETA